MGCVGRGHSQATVHNMPDDDRDLRQKLKPVFAKFDADKSGSISVSEMGKIVKAIGVEMSEADLAQMMKDGDPDGSGEIDFEEFVTVLKKQMKEGGQMADVFTQATNFFGFLNPLSWFEAKPDGKQGGGLFDWNPSSEKNELQRGVSQTKGDRFDTNLDDDPAGIARKELAKRSKERYAREAAELRSQNSGFFTKVRGTGAKEDDDSTPLRLDACPTPLLPSRRLAALKVWWADRSSLPHRLFTHLVRALPRPFSCVSLPSSSSPSHG